MRGVVAGAEQLVPSVEVSLDHLRDRLCGQLLTLLHGIGGASLVQVLRLIARALFAVEDLEHVLVRLFEAQFLRNLVQWEVNFALHVSDRVQAPVEVEAILLADPEQELDDSPLEKPSSTGLVRGCFYLVP